jgi:hypothetical protein
MKKIILTGLLSILLLMNCQMKQKENNDMKLDQTPIVVNDCGVSYNGKQLPFGEPLESWEKALGEKSSRPNFGMFDDLGVAVKIVEGAQRNTSFYIFFTNLESPEGKSGKLTFATNESMKSYEEIEKEYKELGTPMSEELKKEIKADLKKLFDPSQYFYPYKTYQEVINVEGAPIKSDMSLKDINDKREATDSLDIFTFWDRNINMRDETNGTDGKDGEYFQITNKACKGKLYRLVLYFTNYKPEYLRIEQLSDDEIKMLDKLKD